MTSVQVSTASPFQRSKGHKASNCQKIQWFFVQDCWSIVWCSCRSFSVKQHKVAYERFKKFRMNNRQRSLSLHFVAIDMWSSDIDLLLEGCTEEISWINNASLTRKYQYRWLSWNSFLVIWLWPLRRWTFDMWLFQFSFSEASHASIFSKRFRS